jgi:hypothetical protein
MRPDSLLVGFDRTRAQERFNFCGRRGQAQRFLVGAVRRRNLPAPTRMRPLPALLVSLTATRPVVDMQTRHWLVSQMLTDLQITFNIQSPASKHG